jgi:hypothetical protein
MSSAIAYAGKGPPPPRAAAPSARRTRLLRVASTISYAVALAANGLAGKGIGAVARLGSARTAALCPSASYQTREHISGASTSDSC